MTRVRHEKRNDVTSGRTTARTMAFRCAAMLLAGWLSLSTPAAASEDDALDFLGRGDTAYAVGDFTSAIDHWTRTVEICRVAGLPDIGADALARRGETHARMGHLAQATADLGAALERAQEGGDRRRAAVYAGALGNVRLLSRDLDGAARLLDLALAEAEALADDDLMASAANNRGNLAMARIETEAAIDLYRRASEAADRAGDQRLRSVAWVNEARAAVAAERPSDALAALDRVVATAAKAAGPDDAITADQALTLVAAARVALSLSAGPGAGPGADPGANPAANSAAASSGEADKRAYAALARVVEIGTTLNDPRTLSLGNGWLGHLYERHARTHEARRLTEIALFHAQETTAPELRFQWQWQLGRLARDEGDLGAAATAMRAALDDLNRIRTEIPVDYIDGKSSFRERYGPVFLDAADVLLRQAEVTGADVSQTLLVEARGTVEGLKAVELQDYFNDECVSRFKSTNVDLGRIAGSTAVIYPVALADRLVLIVESGGRLTQYVSEISRDELTTTVYRLRQLLEKRTTRQYQRPAKRIWDVLIEPAIADLEAAGTDTLLFVPDGALRTIPLDALFDGRRHLAERFATAVAPGLELVDPRPVGEIQARALVGGVSESVQGFAPLAAVQREVALLGEIYPGRALVDAEFKVDGFSSEIRGSSYDIVHVASHGVFNHQSGDSFILTYDGRMTLDKIEEIIKFRRFDDRPIELLALSACTTATGDDRAALGLAGIALKSGARSALASLWSVNDESSAALIGRFYRELATGEVSKAEALRRARLELLEDRRFRHPFYWSAFLVIGNWT